MHIVRPYSFVLPFYKKGYPNLMGQRVGPKDKTKTRLP